LAARDVAARTNHRHVCGGAAFGITNYELCESVEVDLLDSKWVRVTEIPPAKRRRWKGAFDTTVMKDLPSGRPALRVYAPGVEWRKEWRETKAGELPSKFRTVVTTVESAIPEVQALLADAQHQAEIRRQQWEEQQRRWLKEEAERKRREAFKARAGSCLPSSRNGLSPSAWTTSSLMSSSVSFR
jgi:hypothetical protein